MLSSVRAFEVKSRLWLIFLRTQGSSGLLLLWGMNILHMKYEIIYQLDAIEYLFVFFQLDMFRAYTPIFRSNGCYSFFTYAVCVLVACCTATRHQHTHSSRPTPYYTKDTICCICKETVTSIAPEDGRISPKYVELKEHK